MTDVLATYYKNFIQKGREGNGRVGSEKFKQLKKHAIWQLYAAVWRVFFVTKTQ